MPGHRSKHLRHNCMSDGCFIDALPCWDEYLSAFPRKIHPTDIDGMVEINDHFLFMEEKPKSRELPEGQRKALVRLSTRARITVVFFRAGTVNELEVLVLTDGSGTGWQHVTRLWFTDWLHDWAVRAEAPKPPQTQALPRAG